MGERKDLRDLLRDTDFTQKRIIDDLANPEGENYVLDRGVAGDIKRSEGGDFIKNFFVGVLLVGIVVGSFWVSFLIGKKVLVPPVKSLPTFDMTAPKTLTQQDVEKAVPAAEMAAEAPVKDEEEELQEREIRPVAEQPRITVKKPAAAAPVVVKKATVRTAAASRTARYYKVIVGSFAGMADASRTVNSLRANNFPSYVKLVDGLYRVQAGAFDTQEQAMSIVVKLKAKGFIPTIIIE